MAYLRNLDLACERAGCARKATVELLDRWNGPRGKFCGTHGNAERKVQEARER